MHIITRPSMIVGFWPTASAATHLESQTTVCSSCPGNSQNLVSDCPPPTIPQLFLKLPTQGQLQRARSVPELILSDIRLLVIPASASHFKTFHSEQPRSLPLFIHSLILFILSLGCSCLPLSLFPK